MVLELPIHSAPLGVIVLLIVGNAFTLTIWVTWSVQPFAAVPVMVYVTVVVGDAVTDVPVVALSPLEGAHV